MPFVNLKTNKVEYKFEIAGKFTIIRGDSGTGKSTLYNLVSNFVEDPTSVQNNGYKKIAVIPHNSSMINLEEYEDYVLFIDEHCTLLRDVTKASQVLTESKLASKIAESVEYAIKQGNKRILVIYDAAAFGMYLAAFLTTLANHPDVSVFVLDYDSFECYICNSRLFNMSISLENATAEFQSLERYATFRLHEALENYSKHTLPDCLHRDRCLAKCSKKSSCKYEGYRFDDLVYDGIRTIYEVVYGGE